jgi:membrane fusion protein (multidrug efflux system)
MDRLHVREGSLVDEGELCTSLSDNSKMWVYFNVPEPEYLDYKMHSKPGAQQKVKLRMANNEVFEYPGTVETIEGEFNNETGNIAFRATFQNPKGLLRHGETGSVLMEKPIKNAILIPQKATFEILDKRYVFVIDKEGGVHLTPIVISAEMPDLFVVGKGVTEEDMILLDGLRKVKDGVKIKYDYQDPKQVFAHLKVFAE